MKASSPLPSPRPRGALHRGLTARLVMAMVLMAITVVVLDTLLTRWAFQARFLSYVNEQERATIEQLAERLAELHARTGDWDALEHRGDLARLLTENLREDLQVRLRERAVTDGSRTESFLISGRPDAMDGRRLRTTRRLLPRLHLLDAEGNLVVGTREGLPDRGRIHHTDVVVNDVLVGRIAITPLHTLARESDRRFAAEHTRTMWWIAALAILIAAAVGLALARYLLAPVRAIAAAARQLAEGRYETRLDDSRGDELGALARDFNVLAAGLQSSRESRQRWLADVAHELRTPLAVLRAEIEALRDGIRPVDGAAMNALVGEAERLGHLVDDLHELSLADAGALSYHFAAVDLAALLEGTVERFRGRMQQAGLTLELELPDTVARVIADRDRLDQLLANLLENSLRYTEAPGPVCLSLEWSPSQVAIHVNDGPPGVPAADIPALFERFARREAARDRASGGTGLGLAIARRIAEAHGGTLDARRSGLGGLQVTLCLPTNGSEATA